MISRIRKRLRTIRHRSRYERELDLELQFHLDMLTAQYLRSSGDRYRLHRDERADDAARPELHEVSPGGRHHRGLARVRSPPLGAIPGVVSAGGAGTVPLDGQHLASTPYTLDLEVPAPPDAFAPRASLRVASPGYFAAIGQPVVEGRTFTREDGLADRTIVVVNQTLARNRWPGREAVGRQLRVDGMTPAAVIGVVEDARQRLEEPAGEEIYFPMLQTGQLSTHWLVRSSLRKDEVEARVRAVVRALDPDQPVDNFRSLDSFRDASLLPSRVTATVVGLFSVLALVITTMGIAGVVGFTAAQRRHEFGVRLALGAPRRRVLAMVLRQGLDAGVLRPHLRHARLAAGSSLRSGVADRHRYLRARRVRAGQCHALAGGCGRVRCAGSEGGAC